MFRALARLIALGDVWGVHVIVRIIKSIEQQKRRSTPSAQENGKLILTSLTRTINIQTESLKQQSLHALGDAIFTSDVLLCML